MIADDDDRALVPLATESAPDAPAVVRDVVASVTSTRTTALTLEQVIGVWLDAKAHGKRESRTWRVYEDTLASLRETLQQAGLDLDTPDLTTLETAVQGWARQQRQRDKQGNVLSTPVAGTTFNHRINVASSFFGFARHRRLLMTDNPVDGLERDRVQAYAHAEALDADDVARCLDAIDRSTLIGLRDYALLLLAFNTGRRLAELAGMRWGHLALHGAHAITVTFPHAKGDKIMRDDLARPVADALLTWLRSYYGVTLAELPADAPVWSALTHALTHAPSQGMGGQALGVRAIGYIYERRLKVLGVTKAHSSRHAQPLYSPVLTPTGWKIMGDLGMGDQVVGSDGLPTEVTGIYPQGVQEVLRVYFADGATVDCTADHLWTTRRGLSYYNDKWYEARGTRALEVLPTGEIRDSKYKWSVPVVAPVEFVEASKLPIDSYTLGALLGDGHFGDWNLILSPAVDETEVIARIGSALPSGYMVAGVPGRYILTCRKGSGRIPAGGHVLLTAVRTLGLIGVTSAHKAIPAVYFMAPVADRCELLRGLMDTDGTVTPTGTPMFTTISPTLATGVVNLVRSLGGTARVRSSLPYKTAKHAAYRVTVRTPFTPFHLKRKVERYESNKHMPMLRRIVHIEPIGVAECVCIQVKNLDGLYVTQDYVLTHNTFAHQMRALGADVREIQQRLGHSSSATTERYLGELTSGHNPHAEALAARFVRKGK